MNQTLPDLALPLPTAWLPGILRVRCSRRQIFPPGEEVSVEGPGVPGRAAAGLWGRGLGVAGTLSAGFILHSHPDMVLTCSVHAGRGLQWAPCVFWNSLEHEGRGEGGRESQSRGIEDKR